MVTKSIVYSLSVEGIAQARADFERVSQGIKDNTVTMEDFNRTRAGYIRVTRAVVQEDRLMTMGFLAAHGNIRRFNETMQLTSRITGTVMQAMNALNLVQTMFNTNTAKSVEMTNNVKQAERELAIALKRRASPEEIANLTEQLDLAKLASKEFQAQTEQQKWQGLVTVVATFAHLGSSLGHILTKAPQIIRLFRGIGGFFGRGSGGSGGGGGFDPGSASPLGGFRPSNRPGGGAAPPTTIAPPAMGGASCMNLCEGGKAQMAQAVAKGTSSALGSTVRNLLPVAAATAIGAGITTAVVMKGDQISNTLEQTSVQVQNGIAKARIEAEAGVQTLLKPLNILAMNAITQQTNVPRPAGTGIFTRGDRVHVINPELQPVPVKVMNWIAQVPQATPNIINNDNRRFEDNRQYSTITNTDNSDNSQTDTSVTNTYNTTTVPIGENMLEIPDPMKVTVMNWPPSLLAVLPDAIGINEENIGKPGTKYGQPMDDVTRKLLETIPKVFIQDQKTGQLLEQELQGVDRMKYQIAQSAIGAQYRAPDDVINQLAAQQGFVSQYSTMGGTGPSGGYDPYAHLNMGRGSLLTNQNLESQRMTGQEGGTLAGVGIAMAASLTALNLLFNQIKGGLAGAIAPKMGIGAGPVITQPAIIEELANWWAEITGGEKLSEGIQTMFTAPLVTQAWGEVEQNAKLTEQKSSNIDLYWKYMADQSRNAGTSVNSSSQNLVSASGSFKSAYGAATATTTDTVNKGTAGVSNAFNTGTVGMGSSFGKGTGQMSTTFAVGTEGMGKTFTSGVAGVGAALANGGKGLGEALSSLMKAIASVKVPKIGDNKTDDKKESALKYQKGSGSGTVGMGSSFGKSSTSSSSTTSYKGLTGDAAKRAKAAGFAEGGMINEMVYGVGVSGKTYTFGEKGKEMVIPMSKFTGSGTRGFDTTWHDQRYRGYDKPNLGGAPSPPTDLMHRKMFGAINNVSIGTVGNISIGRTASRIGGMAVERIGKIGTGMQQDRLPANVRFAPTSPQDLVRRYGAPSSTSGMPVDSPRQVTTGPQSNIGLVTRVSTGIAKVLQDVTKVSTGTAYVMNRLATKVDSGVASRTLQPSPPTQDMERAQMSMKHLGKEGSTIIFNVHIGGGILAIKEVEGIFEKLLYRGLRSVGF